MFSHLCRACMVELDQLDQSQTVPLFELYQDVYLNEICNAMNLPMNENDDLGQNVCKKCARTIKQFHTFHSMYMKSNRKLRRMLDSKSAPVDSLVHTSLDIIDLKHRCKKCSACFKTRTLLRQHVKAVHRNDSRNNLDNTESSTNSDGVQLRWKCSYCTSRFQTRDLKNVHQKRCRQVNASGGLNETTEIKENEFVDYNNFDASECQSGSETNNDFDDDYSLTDKESKYKVDLAGMSYADERLKCNKCSESFESLELLRLHDSNQHSDEVDSKLFANVQIKQEQLDVETLQLKTENQENPEYYNNALTTPQQTGNYRWKCVTCWHAFETRELLRIHRRSHTGTRKLTPNLRSGWNCTICDAVLSSRANLQLHKNINHPNAKRERRCNDETKNWGATNNDFGKSKDVTMNQ
ncbi:hypothetical protein HA402_011452 [Bradysia odoriphaga]|nr:hypothetical protein HA402_011452 [Bradysia odoriphaga]